MAQKTFALSVTSHRHTVESDVTKAIHRALEICGGKAETYAKKLCPVSPGGGRLRNSITHQREGDDTELIASDVEYAPYVEWGHHQTPGRYVPAIGKRLVASYVPGKPYMAPALKDHISEYKQIFETELSQL